jgi:hypothetical protein
VSTGAVGYETAVTGELAVSAGSTTSTDVKLTHLPPILLVADDNKRGYDRFFKAALDALAKRYSTLDTSAARETLGPEFLTQYQVVVWFTGDQYSDTLSAADQQALQAFLNAGGSLFITGQDIGYDIRDSDFYKNSLHARWVADTASSKTVTGADLTFKIEGGDGAANQRYPDKVAVNGSATALFNYDSTQGPAGIAGTAGKGRVVYFAFGLEGIDTGDNRKAVFSAVLDYLAQTVEERVARLALLSNLEKRSGGSYAEARKAFEGALEHDITGMDRGSLSKIRDILSNGPSRELVRAANFGLLESTSR